MKGFMLSDGDLSLTGGEIDMVEGTELTAQTIKHVLSTNKGEWLFDEEEGIDFDVIFGKQSVKTTTTADKALQSEYSSVVEDQNALAEKLRRRLDGDT